MRLWRVFTRQFLEMRRDIWVLMLSLSFSSVFILMYWMITSGASTIYDLAVLDNDGGEGAAALIATFDEVCYPNGDPMLVAQEVADLETGEGLLRDRSTDALLIIPAGYSSALAEFITGGEPAAPEIILSGDLTNPAYPVTAILTAATVEQATYQLSGLNPPLTLREVPLGNSATRTEFEIYVPGILVFAIIIIIFQVSMAVTREVESGGLRRLLFSRATALDFLGGVTLAYVLLSLFSIAMTLGVAVLLGFRSQGSLLLAALVAALASLAVIGCGLIVAAISKSVAQAFVIANFPLAFFMFFSGVIYPMPTAPAFTLFGQVVEWYDFIPATHAVNALNRVFTLGGGIADIPYELIGLTVLSLLYFGLGVVLFDRLKMSR
jgi:ABC-2 type transport system permease protein